MSETVLCLLEDIPDGGAKGVETGSGETRRDIILLRRGDCVFAYVNRCPHMGTPLETFPDKFLDQTGDLLICSTHGARFRVRDGFCVSGPCKGQNLEPLKVQIEDGAVIVAGKRHSQPEMP